MKIKIINMKKRYFIFILLIILIVTFQPIAQAITFNQIYQGQTQGQVLGASTISRVQSNSAGAYTGSANNISVTLASPTATGNELIVAVSSYYLADAPYTISDNYGNTYQLATSYSANPYAAIFYAENISGGS